jgi:ketosteroid isomerase-like protein
MKIAAIVLLFAAPVLAAELPPDLARTIKSYDTAQVRNDISTLNGLLSEDFTLVNSNASVEDKRQFLADFSLPGFKIDPYVMDQPMSRVWGRAALISGVVHLSWTQDGRHQTRVLRFGYVWRKRGDHWRLTYTQVTRVPE